jgi:hypothetical protein
MKNKITNWNNLKLKERLALTKHNEQLNSYDVNGSSFAVNAFVKCKKNGAIRYITKEHDNERFEDDGNISECTPSPYCWYENYVMI